MASLRQTSPVSKTKNKNIFNMMYFLQLFRTKLFGEFVIKKTNLIFRYFNRFVFHILNSYKKTRLFSLEICYLNYHGVKKVKHRRSIKKRIKKKIYLKNRHFFV